MTTAPLTTIKNTNKQKLLTIRAIDVLIYGYEVFTSSHSDVLLVHPLRKNKKKQFLQISQPTCLSHHLDQCIFCLQAIVNDLIGRQKETIISSQTTTEFKCITNGYTMLLVHPIDTGATPNIYASKIANFLKKKKHQIFQKNWLHKASLNVPAV